MRPLGPGRRPSLAKGNIYNSSIGRLWVDSQEASLRAEAFEFPSPTQPSLQCVNMAFKSWTRMVSWFEEEHARLLPRRLTFAP